MLCTTAIDTSSQVATPGAESAVYDWLVDRWSLLGQAHESTLYSARESHDIRLPKICTILA